MKRKLEKHVRELIKRKPPLVVVNAVIQKGEEVLLIERAKEPGKGKWVVPGGHLHFDEDPESALVREVEEETGLRIELIGLIDSTLDQGEFDPRGYHLALTYLAIPSGGKIARTSEAEAVKWFKLGDLPHNLGLGCGKYFQETVLKEQQIAELVKYAPPMPMVNQIICKEKTKILIGRRNKPPYFSEWALPGGHFSYKEKIEVAAVRKAREETGLVVKVRKVLDVSSDFGIDPRSKNLVITYLCDYVSGQANPSADFSEFYWYDLKKELPKEMRVVNVLFKKAIENAREVLLG